MLPETIISKSGSKNFKKTLDVLGRTAHWLFADGAGDPGLSELCGTAGSHKATFMGRDPSPHLLSREACGPTLSCLSSSSK